MSDPLTLLRSYNINKLEIIERNGRIIFGRLAWPKNFKTNYIANGTGKNMAAKEYYTLECLLFFLKGVHIFNHGDYMKQATYQSLQFVRRDDREDLLAYLNGKTATSRNIDKPAPLNEISNKMAKRPAEVNAENLALVKKPRMKDELANKVKEHQAHQGTFESQPETKRKTKKTSTTNSAAKSTPAVPTRLISNQINSNRHEKEKPIAKTSPEITTRQPTYQVAYHRYKQEKFNKNTKDMKMFGIDPMKSFLGIDVRSMLDGSAFKVVPKAVLPTVTPSFLKAMVPTSDATISPHCQRDEKIKRDSKTPIIIVPNLTSSRITMLNIKNLLKDYAFVPNEVKSSQGCKHDTDVLITRPKKDGSSVHYRIVDNPLKLSKTEWVRVVAVFIGDGQASQFKGWPYRGGPREIFSKICGFYVKDNETRMDEKTAYWAVNVIELHKTNRHMDRASVLKFWALLDKYMTKNKRHLRF